MNPSQIATLRDAIPAEVQNYILNLDRGLSFFNIDGPYDRWAERWLEAFSVASQALEGRENG